MNQQLIAINNSCTSKGVLHTTISELLYKREKGGGGRKSLFHCVHSLFLPEAVPISVIRKTV